MTTLAEGNPELLGHQFYPQWIPGSQVSIVFRVFPGLMLQFRDGASKPAIPLFLAGSQLGAKEPRFF